MYTYKAFGFVIQSDTEIKELLPCESDFIQIYIKIGTIPKLPENLTALGQNKLINNDIFYLDIMGVSKYYIEKGRLIIFDPYELSLFEEVKLYLLGSCMGALLLQRKILPLHGSCVDINGKGILITGKSGAGKSTIASALLKKDYKMISDDVAATFINHDGKVAVYPSYPSQKLWEDALERSGRSDQKKSVIRVSNDYYKFSVTSNDFFYNDITKLTVIFEIVPSDYDTIVVKEITGFQKINVLLRNTYRKMFLKPMNLKEWQFVTCVNISNNLKVFRVLRPKNKHSEDEIAEIILSIIYEK